MWTFVKIEIFFTHNNDDKCARIISFNHDDLKYLLKRKDHESNNDELDYSEWNKTT